MFDVPRGNIKFLVTPWAQMPSFIADDYDDEATYKNVKGAIQWLANQNGYLFVYATGHGGGYNSTGLDYGRWDADGDEGPEHDGLGVDECIILEADESKYWDDDFRIDISAKKEDLSLAVLMQTCRSVNETGRSCHSGGFIDDLSGPYNTLISSSNETGVSYVGESSLVAEFTYYFMNGLSDFEIVYDGAYTYFDKSSPIDSYKSWRGAYEYALLHDPFYLGTYPGFPECREFPWLDDDGNGLPTYANDTQVLDFPDNGDDLLRWLKCDVNYDGIVEMTDLGIVAAAFGSTPGSPDWNRQADMYPEENWIVDMNDLGQVAFRYGSATKE